MFGGTVSLQTSGRFLLTTSAGHCSKHLLRSTYQESQAFCTLQTVKRPNDASGIDKQAGSSDGMRLPVCRCVDRLSDHYGIQTLDSKFWNPIVWMAFRLNFKL